MADLGSRSASKLKRIVLTATGMSNNTLLTPYTHYVSSNADRDRFHYVTPLLPFLYFLSSPSVSGLIPSCHRMDLAIMLPGSYLLTWLALLSALDLATNPLSFRWDGWSKVIPTTM